MKLEFHKHKKLICKIILYLALLVVYINIYLIDEIQNYSSGRTTLSSLAEKVDFLEAPHITLCFRNPFKPSVLEKYGLHGNELQSGEFIHNTSGGSERWEIFQNLNYRHEKDFRIKLELATAEEVLTPGKEIKYEIQEVATLLHGMCSLIRYQANVSTDDERIRLTFKLDNTTEDYPKSAHLFLHSPSDWYGLINDDWPLIDPTSFKIQIKT